MAITPDRLSKIKTLESAATPGPWQHYDDGNTDELYVKSSDGIVCSFPQEEADEELDYPEAGSWGEKTFNNAVFSAEARTIVPELLAEVQRLSSENDRLRAGIANVIENDLICDCYNCIAEYCEQLLNGEKK